MFKEYMNSIINRRKVNQNIRFRKSTQTTPDKNGESFTIEKLHKMLELVIPETPLFFASDVIDPDACYKMRPDQLTFYSTMANCFDKNVKLLYVCGKNVRDALIKKGVAFENYYPDHVEWERNKNESSRHKNDCDRVCTRYRMPKNPYDR